MTRITKMKRKTYIAAGIELPGDLLETTATPEIETTNKKHRFNGNAEKKKEVELTKAEREALKRRTRRIKKREHNMECFLCRTSGHSVQNCPKNGSDCICFRCGSLEHTLKACLLQHNSKNPLPYAFCFECKQKGHLIGQCSQNLQGLYPNGGSCTYCGSVRHLKKDCKPLEADDDKEGTIGVVDVGQGGDDDCVFAAVHKIQADPNASQQKGNAFAPSAKVNKVVVF